MGDHDPPAEARELESLLTTRLETPIGEIVPLEGGMIGTVARVECVDGTTLVAKTGPTPLETEAFMLEYLAAESELPVPEVHSADDDLLVLEDLPGTTTHDESVARDAADHLVALHEHRGRGFGFPRDTLTGPVRQPNPWEDSWPTFFKTHRLEHAARLALSTPSPLDGDTSTPETGSLPHPLFDRVQAVAADLEHLLEDGTRPALIHGDVWRTNVLSTDGVVTGFLDPATYYADPEVELAYIDWTDTFGEAFFDRYTEHRPLRTGFWSQRRYVYRLYPLLVHVSLFGTAYLEPLEATLSELGY